MTEQEELRTRVEELLSEVKKRFYAEKFNIKEDEDKEIWDEMVDKAARLHVLVKPKHHKYMIKNRGFSPDDPKFYNHIHPIEDLLAFIDDPHANDDPEDQTIGHDFSINVFNRRWGHDDTINIKRTEIGWYISAMALTPGDSNKRGEPRLYEILDHDSINYPEELPGYMEWLWERAKEDGLSHEQVQESLNQLASWISICEKNSPDGIWGHFK